MELKHTLQSAYAHHQAGRFAQAESLYRQVLAQEAENVEALHLLGILAAQAGHYDAAIELIGRAIALDPTHASYHNNLGNALRSRGKVEQAVESYRRAIGLKPDFAEAYGNLGRALIDCRQFSQAVAAYREAVRLRPDFADGYFNLGYALNVSRQRREAIAVYGQALRLKPDHTEVLANLGGVLTDCGEPDQAVVMCRTAIGVRPDFAEAYGNLGSALAAMGRLDEAIAACREAIRLKPNWGEAHGCLGAVLRKNGQVDEAIAAYRQAIRLKPDHAVAYSNLGNSLSDKGQLDEAMEAYRQAVRIAPELAAAHGNLGNALLDRGHIEEAIACYREAARLEPELARAQSNLAFTLFYHPGYDAAAIAEEHRAWDRNHAEGVRKFIPAHANDRDPGRRVRVGYVSADFRMHPVGRFMIPLLEKHDRGQFEIFCYSNVPRPDSTTGVLRSFADQWREIAYLNDEQAAGLIQEDGIDILVDLSGHSAENRLLIFARKPAPVQVSYLGYPGTTGMSAMDYRLTDGSADPPGLTERFHTETLYRLPRTNWCFAEPKESPPVQPPPAIERGYVTFGSFNRLAKVTERMIEVWGRILREVAGSRMLVKAEALAAGDARDRIGARFAAAGIDAGRVTLSGPRPDYLSHLAMYGEMDIMLDTFPYHGTTITCDAMWMGVPVITLAGKSHVSRVGVSLLGSVGLSELVAGTMEEYVRIAVELAGDRDRLKRLRLNLRERMRGSPLMDAVKFARDVEAAYREMWGKWCGGRG